MVALVELDVEELLESRKARIEPLVGPKLECRPHAVWLDCTITFVACYTLNLVVVNSSSFQYSGRGGSNAVGCIQLFQLTLSDFKASSLRDKTER